jgi:hypothetical protein
MSVRVGIVGHGSTKFTSDTEEAARTLIRKLLSVPGAILVSGHSPVGGIDIWSEEIAKELGIPMEIKSPKDHAWDGSYGYRARNLDIARSSDVVNVILVADYPPNFHGYKFNECYHCHTTDHIKSGGCWTGRQAKQLGKRVKWWILKLE